MRIRKATGSDAQAIKELYFEHLTSYPPEEEQDMELWSSLLDKFAEDRNMYLLVAEEDGKVVSSVQMAIIESLTHNVRPFAVVENVVTHLDYRKKGMHPRCCRKRHELQRNADATRFFLKQAPTERVH